MRKMRNTYLIFDMFDDYYFQLGVVCGLNHVDVTFAMMLSKVVAMIGFAVAASAATDKFAAQSGNSASSGYTTLPHVGKVAQTVIKVKIVGPIPAIAMSFVRIFPTPATIALGGVPTGI